MTTSRRENQKRKARKRAKKRATILLAIVIIAGVVIISTQFTDVLAALFDREDPSLPDGETNTEDQEEEEEQNVPTDTLPPVIEGAEDLEVFIGDTISYKKDVVVSDDSGEEVELEVDSSLVNLKVAGTYEVTYRATDSSGNTSIETVRILVKEKPEGYVSEEEVYALADEILAEITNENMTKREVAQAIYNWARTHIGYVNSSEKEDWLKAAYQGFKKRSGDCFVYFSASQALLHRAGIENQGITKTGGGHYWSLINLGDGWYHFDTTPRVGDGDYFFMWTDAEIEAYSKSHKNSHVWDKSKYPATPKN